MAKQSYPLKALPHALHEVVSWLEEICPYKYIEKYIICDHNPKVKGKENYNFTFFTKENRYRIGVVVFSGVPKYMAASMTTRKPRAGEDWNRGNDLPDGEYSKEKWNSIKAAIIATELVKIVRTQYPKAEHLSDKTILDVPPLSHEMKKSSS